MERCCRLVYILIMLVTIHGCCPTCSCPRYTCRPPQISANISANGVSISCPDSTCACVADELDTCTYGGTWSGETLIEWSDARWVRCIRITHHDPLQASGIIRWWDETNRCMGHMILNIDTHLLPVQRDVYVDFEKTVWHKVNFHHEFIVKSTSGCEDCTRPIVGVSIMFFKVEMDPPVTGASVQIRNCSVLTLAGINGIVESVFPIITDGPHQNGQLNTNRSRLTYIPFWDDVTNSPFQQIKCSWAVFNGTIVNSGMVERDYMIADPVENGILIHT
jgi:hypothetical protein